MTENINKIIQFLAKRDIDSLTCEALRQRYGIDSVDLLVVAGNCIPFIAQQAAIAFQNGVAKKLMFSGGVGHTTNVLRKVVNAKFPDLETLGKSEAEIFSDLLFLEFGIPKNEMLLEKTSANTGENARFALRAAKEHGITPQTMIVMQDPALQLRTDATFKLAWKNENTVIINYAAFVPQVISNNGALSFCDNSVWGLWEMDHFISLILGEIPRIIDNENGYGPNGKGFIEHVEVPTSIFNAHELIQSSFGHLTRK